MLVSEPEPILCLDLTEKVSRNLFWCSQALSKLVGDVPTPHRFAGVAPHRDDGEPFRPRMKRLVAQLYAQQTEEARLDAAIAENLKLLGFLSYEERR